MLATCCTLGCEAPTKNEVATPQADFYESIGMDESNPAVAKVVELQGLYEVRPANSTLSLDVTVDFRDNNESIWTTNIGDVSDQIHKKYRVVADALYVTHDLEAFNAMVEEERKKGNEGSAAIMEDMLSRLPAVDKYRIEVDETDTIRLIGSRVSIDLIKITEEQ